MTEPEKILILYASAGAGHKKAAEAIFHSSALQKSRAQLIDIVDFMSPAVRWFYTKGYIFAISHLVWLWTFLYFLSDTPWLRPFNVHFRRFFDSKTCARLIRFIREENPQAIISTQFLASEIVTYAKQKFNLKTKLISVVTDFEVHNFWINPLTDIYCCATETTRAILMQKGVEENRIKVTGIPVHEKFTKPQNEEALLTEFNLRKDTLTVLIMTGGIGAGPIEEIVDSLKDIAQILVVCGNNKALYEKISQKKYPDVRLFGFVDFVEKLMRVSKIIVTKAGGLSVTESLVMGLPMIFFYLIPGQEMNNAKTMKNYEVGIIANSPEEIKASILKFKNNPDEIAACKKRILSLAKPNAAQEIVSLLN